jgi:hypothetical protein
VIKERVPNLLIGSGFAVRVKQRRSWRHPRRRAAVLIALIAVGGAIYLAGIAAAVFVLSGSGESAAAAGTCEAAGLISVGDSGLCTHGPDTPPPGVNPATVDEPVFEAAADFSKAVCTGSGTDGRRIQVIYARRSDQPSRLTEYLPSFRTWSAQASQIFTDSAAQTGGQRYLRFVHNSSCVIDVDSVTLTAAGASNFSQMVYELTNKGYGRSDRKYLVFLDVTDDDICGLGTVYPDDWVSTGNTNNIVKGYALIYNGCWSSTRTISHELSHNFGAVQSSAPNSTAWSHCTDEWDIMCYEDGSGEPMEVVCEDASYQGLLDCNHDDYFHTSPPSGNYLATHWNIARSGWLGISGAPPPTTVPFNNLISQALTVGTLPWLHETNTLWATTSSNDPIPPGDVNCWSFFSKTIWYKFTAPATGDYQFDTIGSSYDTVVGTFTGTPSNLTQLKCNDDLDDISLDSRVRLTNLAAGTTVYIMVGAFSRPTKETIPTPGGYLRFNVQRLAKVSLSPTSGGYAMPVTFTLSGFTGNTSVSLKIDGKTLTANGAPVMVTTNSQGTAQGVFPVPSGPRGYHTIEATGGGRSATARLMINPRIRVSPSGGGVGSTVRVSLTGFEPGETVKIRWLRPDAVYVTIPVTLSNGTTTTGPAVSSTGSGSWTITVPSVAGPGSTTIRAAGTATDSAATVSFMVSACTPSPTTVYAGLSVSLTCTGFQSGETVDVFWRSTSTTPIATFVAGPSGSGGVTFKAPAATRGQQNLIVRGRTSSRVVIRPVTVTSYLRLTPASGLGGVTVSAKAYGFKAGEEICVRWTVSPGVTTQITCALVADAVGSSASFSFVVPGDAEIGQHAVVATGDLGSTATRVFNVTGQAAEPTEPPVPTSTPTTAPTATQPVPPTATPTTPPTATQPPPPTATPAPTDTPTPTPTETPLP